MVGRDNLVTFVAATLADIEREFARPCAGGRVGGGGRVAMADRWLARPRPALDSAGLARRLSQGEIARPRACANRCALGRQ